MIPQSNNASLQSIRREVDLAWLAGIVDGEGNLDLTFHRNKNGCDYLSTKVRIFNTDIRMIKKVSEIYKEMNLVFCFTLGNNGKNIKHNWKTQMGIQVASHGSTGKLLKAIIPYLVNKKEQALKMLEMIEYRKEFAPNGSRIRLNYCQDKKYQSLMSEYQQLKKFYINPSETTRRAGTVLAW